jgi:colicin import membrane protein
MGEPARKMPIVETGEPSEPDVELLDGEPSEITILQRWIERPDGRMELVELPLTPELFLDPELEDTMVQGRAHGFVRNYFFGLLMNHLEPQGDFMVLEDVKHFLIPGLPAPAPDVSVIRGARHPDRDLNSFDAEEQGVVPCLVIEVVSPRDARIRRMDEVDKVKLYERAGIQEYLLVDLPRRATQHRFRIKGYRLDAEGRYRPIEPDPQGCLPSVTTDLRFGVSEQGDGLDIYDVATGERLLTSLEQEIGRKTAEERAGREAAARQAAEERAGREAAARQAAEERAGREAAARQAAEEKADREAAARQAAEEKADREAAARQAAEEKADREAEARKAAEDELAQLRAKIEQLSKPGD